MVKQFGERFFSFLQTIIFKQVGNKIHTNSLKILMDRLFIIVEKIGSKFQFFIDYYLDVYQEIVDQEIRMCRILQTDRILVIGSGTLPATAVLYAMKTHAFVIAIDRDHRAVQDAKQYVEQFHGETQLKIEHADGFSYQLDDFDVIVVLYGVRRQAEMIAHLGKKLKATTRVIVRVITDAHGNILDNHIDISKYFLIKDHVRSESLGSVGSFLLLKK